VYIDRRAPEHLARTTMKIGILSLALLASFVVGGGRASTPDKTPELREEKIYNVPAQALIHRYDATFHSNHALVVSLRRRESRTSACITGSA
jgi:hypothetical protein